VNVSPGEIIAILTGVAVIIANVSTAYVIIAKSRRDAQESREDRARNAQVMQNHLEKQDVALVKLHESTNGLAAKAEKLAGLLGEATGEAKGILKGRADEKANPS
jgi:hypothetical protein